jgi:antitoxin component of MazEF toxin-antitoxin module
MGKGTRIKTKVRKAIGAGGSLLVTLPKEFCKRNDLGPGSELAMIFDHELVIRPWVFENVARFGKPGLAGDV